MICTIKRHVPPRGLVQPRAILTLVVLATALSNLEVGLVNVALPAIAATFDAGPATIQWVAIAYQLAIVGTLIVFGRLVDLMGGRPLYLAGMTTIIIASILAFFSSHIIWLILARSLLGLGAAMLLATGQALLVAAYPRQAHGRALGFVHAAVASGLMAGPAVGGLLVTTIGWRAVFLAPLPLAAGALWWGWKILPVQQDWRHEPLDLGGAGLFLASAVIVVFSLTRLAREGLTLGTGGLFALALCIMTALGFHEHRQTAPLVDTTLLSRPGLSIGLVATFLTFIALASNMFLVPFALQDLLGRSTAEAGLMMMVVPLVILPIAPMAGVLADRFGSRLPASAGLVVIVSSIIGMAQFAARTPAWIALSILALYGIGAGLFQAPNNRAVLDNAPSGREGTVSGMLALSRNFGQIAGVSIASAVWTSRGGANGNAFAPEALATGLRDAFLILAGIGVLALLVSTIRFRQEGSTNVTG